MSYYLISMNVINRITICNEVKYRYVKYLPILAMKLKGNEKLTLWIRYIKNKFNFLYTHGYVNLIICFNSETIE
jgi:hypothetical protein